MEFEIAKKGYCVFIFTLLFGFSAILQAQETTQKDIEELKRQVEILTEEIEKLKLGEVTEDNYESVHGFGPAASKIYRQKNSGVSIAGYGEVVYENFSDKKDDGSESGSKNQFDYLRNIIYIGYKFNDWILFNGEIEIEHVKEIFMEFGYIDLMINPRFNIRAGMVLVPIGIINELHEPPTWHGTKRPQVEQKIIPTTWRGNGGGIFGEIMPGLNYRTYLVEGLKGEKFTASSGIRGGRQKGAKAVVENMGITGRLEYTGMIGANLGVSFYTGKSGQGITDGKGNEIDAQTTVFSAHGTYNWKSLELRGLFAQVDIGDDVDSLSSVTGQTIGSSLNGFYITAAYDILPKIYPNSLQYLAPFVQYEKYNTQASVPDGFTASDANDVTILSIGLTYKPHPNVAFKFDYRDNSNAADTSTNQWNLVVSYLF